jgi:hypothetical protein
VEFPFAFSITADILLNWVSENLVPRYRARNGVTFRDLTYDPRPVLLSFVDTSHPASLDLLHSTFDQLYQQFAASFNFVYADVFDMGDLVLHLGFSGAREPLYCIGQLRDGNFVNPVVFPERKSPTPENVERWVSQYGSAGSDVSNLFEVNYTELEAAVQGVEGGAVALILAGDSGACDRSRRLFYKAARRTGREMGGSVQFFVATPNGAEILALGLDEPTVMLVSPGPEKSRRMVGCASRLQHLWDQMVAAGIIDSGFEKATPDDL